MQLSDFLVSLKKNYLKLICKGNFIFVHVEREQAIKPLGNETLEESDSAHFALQQS